MKTNLTLFSLAFFLMSWMNEWMTKFMTKWVTLSIYLPTHKTWRVYKRSVNISFAAHKMRRWCHRPVSAVRSALHLVFCFGQLSKIADPWPASLCCCLSKWTLHYSRVIYFTTKFYCFSVNICSYNCFEMWPKPCLTCSDEAFTLTPPLPEIVSYASALRTCL